jgi:MFS family permease
MLDVSVINVALPSVERTLNTTSTEIQLIVSGYALALSLIVIPGGRLGDMYGRRKLFILGVSGFALASLLVGMSSSGEMLALARVAQGACAGLINPQASGIIQQLFKGAERGRAFGLFGMMIGVSTALGPVVGGLLIQMVGPDAGWRWVFYINIPIVLVVIPLAVRLLPDIPPGEKTEGLDPIGLIVVGLSALTVMTPFMLSGARSGVQIGNERWLLLPVGLVLLIILFFHERRYQKRTQAAIFDPVLLGDQGFRNGILIGSFYFAGFTSVMLIVTVMLQQGMGYSALGAGLLSMPWAIGSGISSNISGRLVGKYGRVVVVGALSIILLGLVMLDLTIRFVPDSWMAVALGASLFVAGFGGGGVISPNNALTLALVPVRVGGVAGAMMQIFQQLGSAIGMAIVLAGFFANIESLGPKGAAALALIASIGIITVAWAFALYDARRRGAQENPLANRQPHAG